MHSVTFTYESKVYNGYIASSTIKEPYFHWLFYTDQALIDMTGDDCIAFKQDHGGPLTLYNHIPKQHRELVTIAERLVKEYLDR